MISGAQRELHKWLMWATLTLGLLPFPSNLIIMIKAYMHVVSVLNMMLELPVLELLSKQDTYTAVDVS